MFRIILACDGVPANDGPQGALDITEEFLLRPWHHNVECTWDGQLLVLQAENDFDENGLALMDEFSDAVSACVSGGLLGYGIRLVSIGRPRARLTRSSTPFGDGMEPRPSGAVVWEGMALPHKGAYRRLGSLPMDNCGTTLISRRRIFLIGLSVTAGVVAFFVVPIPTPELSRQELIAEVKAGNVHEVVVVDREFITGVSTRRGAFRVVLRRGDNSLLDLLAAMGIEVKFEKTAPGLI